MSYQYVTGPWANMHKMPKICKKNVKYSFEMRVVMQFMPPICKICTWTFKLLMLSISS